MLQCTGFDDRWTGWVNGLLSSGSSSVLLNGVPGQHFMCRTGVRQGDPLSPLLFVIAVDLLQSVVTEICTRNILTMPIPTSSNDYPIVQYTNDTLIVLPAVDDQILAFKEMLDKFALSTGLKVNISKSSLISMNTTDEKGLRVASLLGCDVGTMPFTYLGLPMGTSRPTIYDLLPLVDRIERRLSASSCFLNQGSRLLLLQYVLASMPIYFLCSLSLPPRYP